MERRSLCRFVFEFWVIFMLSLLSLYVFSFFLEQKKLPTVVYLFVFGFLGVVEESNNNVALAGGGSGGLYCGLVSLFLKKNYEARDRGYCEFAIPFLEMCADPYIWRFGEHAACIFEVRFYFLISSCFFFYGRKTSSVGNKIYLDSDHLADHTMRISHDIRQ